jgi:hypothetical protein
MLKIHLFPFFHLESFQEFHKNELKYGIMWKKPHLVGVERSETHSNSHKLPQKYVYFIWNSPEFTGIHQNSTKYH